MYTLKTGRLGLVKVQINEYRETAKVTVEGKVYKAKRLSSRAVFLVGRYVLKVDLPGSRETKAEIALVKMLRAADRKFLVLPIESGKVEGKEAYWSISLKHSFIKEDRLDFKEQNSISDFADKYKLTDGVAWGRNTGVLKSGQIKIFDYGQNLFYR